MKYISAESLKSKLDNKEDIALIDLREDYEFEDFNLGGKNIPLDTLFNNLDEIPADKPVIFCCNSGKRAVAMVHTLEQKHNYQNLYILKGGVESYLEEFGI
ncbi:MAG: hypothetical protein Kow0079_07120 [Vicingaceae bacterium]